MRDDQIEQLADAVPRRYTVLELTELFPDETRATEWFEQVMWDG